MAFQIAPGHNNTTGYQTFDPQPSSEDRITYEVYRRAASGQVKADGRASIRLTWTAGPKPGIKTSQAETILSQCGLSETVFSAPVTVSLPEDDYSTFNDYNGTAEHRQTREYRHLRPGYGYYDVFVIDITQLEAI